MMTGLHAAIVLLLSFAGALKAWAVPTRSEFYSEIVEHRNRVQAHALEIFKSHPELFPNLMSLPEKIRTGFIEIYLSTHDQPKIMNLEELKALGYLGNRTLFDKLHENWGIALKRGPYFIRELNDIESRYKKIVMDQHFSQMDRSLFEKVLKEVEWMEFVADETDAKVKRGPELGVDTKPFDAEKMFRDHYHDEKAAEISRWLEIKYYKKQSLIFCEAHFRIGAEGSARRIAK